MTQKGKVPGVRQRGKKYFIDYRADGKRVREIVGSSKKQAELVLSKRKVEVVENRHFNVRKAQKITLNEFVKMYLDLHSRINKKPSVIIRDQVIIKNLLRKFGGKYLYQITPMMIEKYKSERLNTVVAPANAIRRHLKPEEQKKVSPATVNRELAGLKSMFNKAILWKKATENPVRQVQMLKEDNQRLRYLEEAEMKKLIEACQACIKPIVILAVNTGMRKGEMLNLKWKDVDLERRIIYLLDTKNSEKREVFLNETAVNTLRALTHHPTSEYVFCKANGSKYNDIKGYFGAALKKCGILNFKFHDLRHTFASHLVMAGVDLKTVQELLGHKTMEMTLRYSHLSPDHKKRAVEVLCNKMGTVWAQEPIDENVENKQ